MTGAYTSTDRFVRTYTGRKFFYGCPERNVIAIEDIAYALAGEPRFGAHARHRYSVAQHSVFVASVLPARLQFEGLMHDASEAYMKDIPSPLKAYLPEYKRLELRVARVIRVNFSIPVKESPEVKHADLRMLVTEAREFMPNWEEDYPELVAAGITPYPFHPKVWTAKKAERAFLDMFAKLSQRSMRL